MNEGGNLDICRPIDVAKFIEMPSSALSYRDLIKLSDYLFRLVGELDEPFARQIKDLIKSIESSCQDLEVKSWAKKTLSKHFCSKCSNRCIAKGVFPYKLCNQCKLALVSSHKCLNCYRKFQNNQYRMPCDHLCKFCGCLWIKKGYEACPECSFNYLSLKQEIKTMSIQCSFCLEDKNLYLNPVLMLSCKHFICSECFLKNSSLEKCAFEEKKIRSSLRKTFIEYIQETCYKCESKKRRSKMVNKTCCNVEQLCQKCVGSPTICPLCRNEIILNQFSF